MPTQLSSFWDTIIRALSLDRTVFASIQTESTGLWVALSVVLLAGLSDAFGQSIVLFLNRVTPKRFWLALFISAISYVASFLLWTAIVWGIGVYVFERTPTAREVASVVGLSYAPRLLFFFTLIPFLGYGFSVLLSIWSMLAIVVAIQFGIGLELWQAIVASGLGWLAVQVWQRTIGRPVYAIDRWVKSRAAGVQLQLTLQDIAMLRRRPVSFWESWIERLEQTHQSSSISSSLPSIPKNEAVKGKF
ncbi:hypothetical protein KFU94_46950 [Chloroflexi bacterium TSY]|nr:hypothetical protein [Chloroflexi bacterium TSY]